ncbi:hypothetical protein E2C01_018587 [Portunus trituberculatus]|uniref:Uncharacterized protein n=1 Tax=Portunus trituberculatus TaxID=210409 RepID=A0A5B7DVE8_PORTR|nr:hypothetical protein [Portunus trituberculatus]
MLRTDKLVLVIIIRSRTSQTTARTLKRFTALVKDTRVFRDIFTFLVMDWQDF